MEIFGVTVEASGAYGQGNNKHPQHTLGHFECPACDELRQMYSCTLSATLTFAEAAEIYMRMRSVDVTPGAITSARYIKQTTIQSYEQYIRTLNLFFGPMVLSKIHVGHRREYQMARLEGRAPFIRFRRPQDAKPTRRGGVMVPAKGRSPCKAKPTQIRKELCLLKMILRRAGVWTDAMEQEWEDFQENGADIPRALSQEEQQRWLEIARIKPRWNVVYWYSVLAFATTCSTNELRALRIGDVNLQHRTITVPADGAKCRGRQRTIAIENADALWALEKLLERAAEMGATDPQHFLFPFWVPKKNAYDPTRPMTVSGLKRRWEEVREATHLKAFRMYDTRHTAITRLAEQGVPIAVIMSLAGHLSPRMTAHYTQISEAVQRRWLQGPLIPGPLAPQPKQTHLYAVPSPQTIAPAKPEERPGYKTIYIGGVSVSIPA